MVLLSEIFQRQILKHAATLCPETHNNRPRTLCDDEASRVIFKVARTGMQWREITASVSYATVFRRAQTWAALGVVDAAYASTLCTYKQRTKKRGRELDDTSSEGFAVAKTPNAESF